MEKNSFSPFAVPLEGAQLIEASAGTGKTYTITSLFLRLVLERPLDVRSILVVTFTEAATGELRYRVRNRLRAALDAFQSGSAPPGDTFLQELLTRHTREHAVTLLTASLADFDEAAIFTIHGFCQRVLHDMAFEAGGLFDTELISSQDDLLRRAVDDFWRKTIYKQSSLFTAYCLQTNLSADRLYSLVGRHIGKPELVIIPQHEPVDTGAAEQDFLRVFEHTRAVWQRDKEAVREFLQNSKDISRKSYQKRWVEVWLAKLDAWLQASQPLPQLFEKAERLTAEAVGQAAAKIPADCAEFFTVYSGLYAVTQALAPLFEQQALAIEFTAFFEVRRDLEKRKEAQNIRYFDDLLLGVYRGLTGPEADRLAAAIRARFSAALIDEFQDTDPVQYAIFAKVFHHPSSTLFLIGDPKQAIYSFRSADIYTYLDAAGQVQLRHHLATNFRSDPQLIRGINTLFSRTNAPFLFKNIEFIPAVPDPNRTAENAGSPFELWFVPEVEHADLAVGQLRRKIARCTAGEIASLINTGEHPGAIAVLVRTHTEAEIMQRELARLRVACIRQSTETIFDTPEAAELELVLRAVAEPAGEKYVRTACATLLLGGDAALLFDLEQGSPANEARLMRFADYQDLWQRQGCFAMLRSLIRQEAVLERLVKLPQGERRVTNLLHLAEVLHRQEVQAAPGMEGLVDWLACQRNPDSPRLEEHQLRLESDADAVRIVTIHKSKGLEYPVVFCPFSWGRAAGRSGPALFHDPDAGERLTLDIGSPDEEAHKRLADREALAEDLRLLYVALTRAKRRCYLVWGAFAGSETSALAYLLHGEDVDPQADILAQMKERFKLLDEGALRQELTAFKDAAGGAVAVREISLAEAYARPVMSLQQPLAPLVKPCFTGAISRAWRIASFSSLIAGRPHEQEFPQSDEFANPVSPARESAGRTIFSLPPGAQTGSMLHKILEKIDFADPRGEAARSLVLEKLAEYGVASEWCDVVLGMLAAVAGARLRADGAGFSLQTQPAAAQLPELGFYFPLQPLSKDALAHLFSESRQPDFTGAIEELVFSPVAGYMNGFIDLVFCHEGRFYLIDWKSNHLGPVLADYAPERLAVAMRDNFYFLQYHIYTLALHRYLQLRQPGYDYEKHFGGVFYLFLRGIDPREPGSGIYFDRPAFELIRKMEERLIEQ